MRYMCFGLSFPTSIYRRYIKSCKDQDLNIPLFFRKDFIMSLEQQGSFVFYCFDLDSFVKN